MSVIDRRTALAVITGVGSNLLLTEAAAAASTGPSKSILGGWKTDEHGLPTYAFTADVPVNTITPAGHPYPLDADPLFLLGNYDLTLFASVSGRLLLVSGEHGWVRLNESTPTTPGHAATLKVAQDGKAQLHHLLGPGSVCAARNQTARTFGCGAARYHMTPQPGLTVERILSVAPSNAEHRAPPAVVVTVRLTNTGAAPLDLEHVETVLSNPTLLSARAPASGVRPVSFVNTARLLSGGQGVICDAAAISDDPKLLTAISEPGPYNLFPPSLLLAPAPSAAGVATRFGFSSVDGGAVALTARSSLRLDPGATRDIVLVIALKSQEDELEPLQTFTAALAPSSAGSWFREAWVSVLAPLSDVPDAALRAELQWDGHALLAMATYAAYYRQTFIPQGMTYDYYMDVNSGPRDHLQHAMAAAYFAPELAKSAILYTLCTMTYQGGIKFTVSGNGMTSNSSWSPSDNQLFLFYAVGEYLRITKDWRFLEIETAFLPGGEISAGTVLQKLGRAFVYLRDHVSTGSHGLVRLLTGDWNDQIYAGVPNGQFRETAESQMNSAMVMAVIPPLIDQLQAYSRTQPATQAAVINALSDDMRTYAETVGGAMMRDMEGRTYARRAWLAPGKALGEDDMYLEPQSFLLQSAEFPLERKRTLLRQIQRRLCEGEALGPRQREKPAFLAGMTPGTSENGGFWYSLAGQAIAGTATFDHATALTMLDRMTFRNFSRHHPDYWVGQWTAPDTLNAEMVGDIAGLPRPMGDEVFLRMANYCAHAHAWPIYCYFRILDSA